jgi:hypothetical protein
MELDFGVGYLDLVEANWLSAFAFSLAPLASGLNYRYLSTFTFSL